MFMCNDCSTGCEEGQGCTGGWVSVGDLLVSNELGEKLQQLLEPYFVGWDLKNVTISTVQAMKSVYLVWEKSGSELQITHHHWQERVYGEP